MASNSALLITRDLGVILRMASRVIVLKDGCIIEEGATATVFAASTDPCTRGLLEAASRASRLKATNSHERLDVQEKPDAA